MTTTHRGRAGAGPGADLAGQPQADGRKLPGMTAADLPVPGTLPAVIGVRGARHNNLRDIDVDVPLWRTVAVVGVSGSGKTSLAIGTLYAEGLQRFLESLSTYSRRRLSQAQRPDVDRIEHLPPALALRQRPPVPGPRSTVGTMSEVLNVLRLMMSRLGTHLCPNGHRVAPSIATLSEEIVCPVCGARFEHPSAESFAFNSYGACPACQGLGVRSEVDVSTLVPDQDKTIADGAVLPWNSGVLGLSVHDALAQFAGQAGVIAALRPVSEVGLGYLRLGEPTPSLSGGESQRLRIASRLRSSQRGALYVFDEPSTGLHPLDVATLVGVFDRLLEAGATIIVIDHDLDLLAAADHLIDMGPGGGPDGGHILAAGTPEEVVQTPGSATGPWLAEHLGLPQAQPDVPSRV